MKELAMVLTILIAPISLIVYGFTGSLIAPIIGASSVIAFIIMMIRAFVELARDYKTLEANRRLAARRWENPQQRADPGG